jgi:D-alanyl-D-alanine dipeptidase
MFFGQHSSLNTKALSRRPLSGVLFLVLFLPVRVFSEGAPPITESTFVDIKRVDPTILIDLRYAGSNNSAHRPLYPQGMPAMVRFSVAERLAFAQKYLKARGYGLKIWDAYRPKAVQEKLWDATRNNDYVADPREGIGSMHTRGAAVDVTLVNVEGREVPMPTEFDDFTPAAMLYYQGRNPVIRSNLKLLQKAMARAGFYGLRTEWWHFCAGDWTTYPPVPEIQLLAQAPQGL